MRRYNLQKLDRIEHGGFWVRVLATLIDAAILFIPTTALEVLTDSKQSLWVEAAVSYGVWAVYSIPFWATRWHATPGKMLCDLTIVTADGCDLSWSRALFRYLAAIVSGAVIVGPLLVAFTERRQGLHDLIADTVVVKRSVLAKVAI